MRFIEADVLNLEPHLSERFDIVFTSYGVLTWLNDLSAWGRAVARLLKPDGLFFISEIHPSAMMLEGKGDQIFAAYDYFHGAISVSLPAEPDYADHSYVPHSDTCEWQWSLADIFSALKGAGLRIANFRDYSFSCFQHFPQMTQSAGRRWHLPATIPQVPLLFSFRPS